MAWENEAQKIWDNYDPLKKMREHNKRVEDAARRRVERYYETRAANQIQILPVSTAEKSESKLPEGIRGILEKVKRAHGDFRLFHFTLQCGRLRIEFSQARRTGER